MSENNAQERDTHFLGFAKLLREEITKPIVGPQPAWFTAEQLDRLIAQRAYDLLWHAFTNVSTVGLEHASWRVDIDQVIDEVPDLTAWPEQDKKPEEQ